MGEKESAGASARTATQDFEKNTEAAGSGHIYQHNQSDLEFRQAGGEPDPSPPGGEGIRKDITVNLGHGKGRLADLDDDGGASEGRISTNVTVERQTPKRDFGD